MTTGPDYVSADRARELVTAALGPQLDAFRQVRPGTWACPLSDEIEAVLTLDSWKGAQLTLGYGAWCRWIPMRAGDRDPYHWPEGPRELRKHLFVDHFTVDEPAPRSMPRLQGERALRTAADAAVRDVFRRAERWWATVSSPYGVLEEARRQSANRYDVHRPRAQFVVAFTLARLGRLDEARDVLESLDLAGDEGEETAQRLADELRGVAERSRPGAT